MSAVLDDTLEHWVVVKRIRRELQALMGADSTASITLADYDHYRRTLNEHQLAFERLKKLALLLNARILTCRSRVGGHQDLPTDGHEALPTGGHLPASPSLVARATTAGTGA